MITRKTQRCIIFPEDIMRITGLAPETCRRMIRRMRRFFNKPTGAYITIHEFCFFTGISEDYVMEYMK